MSRSGPQKATQLIWWHWVLVAVVSFLAVPLIFAATVFWTVRSVGPSMLPVIEPNEVIFVAPLWMGGALDRGDIVLIETPSGRIAISRLIGLPGDTVETRDSFVVLNDETLQTVNRRPATSDGDQAFARFNATYLDETILRSDGKTQRTYTVADIGETPVDNFLGTDRIPSQVKVGHYFLMGDNRDNSGDSRTALMGQVGADQIIGRPILVLYSFKVPAGQTDGFSIRFARTFKVLR